MIVDVLRGECCPNCGASALATAAERAGQLDQFIMCECRDWWRLDIWLIRCGLCAYLWPLVVQAQQVDAIAVVEASRR